MNFMNNYVHAIETNTNFFRVIQFKSIITIVYVFIILFKIGSYDLKQVFPENCYTNIGTHESMLYQSNINFRNSRKSLKYHINAI